jgi:hypothetical protein
VLNDDILTALDARACWLATPSRAPDILAALDGDLLALRELFWNPAGEIHMHRFTGTLVAWLIIAIFGFALWGFPLYNVYASRLAGEAELARANYSKQVQIQASLSKMEAAKYEAQAEVIRAGGVAKANKIIGDSLQNNEAYLRYLFVNNLADTKDQVIYVPTEAQLPILEAGRRPTPNGQ